MEMAPLAAFCKVLFLTFSKPSKAKKSSSVKPTASPVILDTPIGQTLTSQGLGISRKTKKAILGLAVAQLFLALIVVIWLSLLLANDFVLSLWGFLLALSVVIFVSRFC